VLDSFVRACGVGSCDRPGKPAEECSVPLDVQAGAEVEVTITYRVTKGCSIKIGATDLGSIPTPEPSFDWGDAGAVTGILDFGEGAKGLVGDPVDLARDHFEGLLKTDELQVVSQTDEQAIVAVVRDARIVATATYITDSKGGWLLIEVRRCSDSGLIG
jgi:hypothetical protein